MLADGDLIRNLLGRYCDLVDGGHWDDVGRLFADGVLATEDGVVLAAGADEVAAFYRRGTRRHDGSPRTKHVIANTVLDAGADGDGDRIVARSSYLVLQAVEDAMPLQPIITGRYVDTFERATDGWVWRERRFSVDLVGDLSQHLGYSL